MAIGFVRRTWLRLARLASIGAAGFVRGTPRWLRSAHLASIGAGWVRSGDGPLASIGATGFVRRRCLRDWLRSARGIFPLPTAYCLLPTRIVNERVGGEVWLATLHHRERAGSCPVNLPVTMASAWPGRDR